MKTTNCKTKLHRKARTKTLDLILPFYHKINITFVFYKPSKKKLRVILAFAPQEKYSRKSRERANENWRKR